MGQPLPLFVYFRHFKQTLQFLQQINVKNVYGAGIRTHDLRKTLLLLQKSTKYQSFLNWLSSKCMITVTKNQSAKMLSILNFKNCLVKPSLKFLSASLHQLLWSHRGQRESRPDLCRGDASLECPSGHGSMGTIHMGLLVIIKHGLKIAFQSRIRN